MKTISLLLLLGLSLPLSAQVTEQANATTPVASQASAVGVANAVNAVPTDSTIDVSDTPPETVAVAVAVAATDDTPSSDAASDLSAAGAAILAELTTEEQKQRELARIAANKGSIFNRPNARVMTLATPGIRGAILDRNGLPLAISMVSYFPSLHFGQLENEDDEYILEWAKERIAHINNLYGINWTPKDLDLLEHYKYRRWMEMPYTFYAINQQLKDQTEDKLMDGIVLHPIYQRYYPNGTTAAHLIGYTGLEGNLEKGPINYADPIFPYAEGKTGIELFYDDDLKGKEGLKRIQFASDGTQFPEEIVQAPTIGANVITSLDLKWQKKAEEILSKACKKGAFVVIDIQTGEVLVMASLPTYDLNLFVPRTLASVYNQIRDDEDIPFFGRAYQAAYPPASSFKVIVALDALQQKLISRNSTINCPAYIEFGGRKFSDWSGQSRGQLNVLDAVTMSNNPFFYQIGNQLGSSDFISFARKFGFGEKTGLPLLGESAGNMPDNYWMQKYHNRKFHRGDNYNNSIGQGVLLTTPLQVAQAMATIANGTHLPKLQLVKQIQSPTGKVIAANAPDFKQALNIDPLHIATIREGMMQVANTPRGTGKKGALDYAIMCAKTGTGQWKPAYEQRVAWYAGFFPYSEPRFAFAVLCEGERGEEISGGSKAGPVAKQFFEAVKDDVIQKLAPPTKAVAVDYTPTTTANPNLEPVIPRAIALDPITGEPLIPRAVPADESANPTPPDPNIIPRAVPADLNSAPQSTVPVEEVIPRAVPASVSEEDEGITPPRRVTPPAGATTQPDQPAEEVIPRAVPVEP
ncbi:penicillin-binding transpeptidase domain-containing protein [Akkermansiaceae bacterium]|nr:penicillin-binding transpeptidase domain-containing protein [Akkermansiaceae bacterium]